MLQEIIDSIFTPGINSSVRIFTIVVFILLILVLFVMLFLTNFNIHIIVMFLLSIGVLVSLCWFMYELEQSKIKDGQDETADDGKKKEN